jgi:hypothetical protein
MVSVLRTMAVVYRASFLVLRIPVMPAGILLFPYKGGAPQKPRDLKPLLEPVRVKHDLPAMAAAVFTGEKIDGAGAIGRAQVRRLGAGDD